MQRDQRKQGKNAQEKDLGPGIGIDLGTTYSCVSVMQHSTVEIITNSEGNRTTPSYAAFTETDRLIGEAARNQAPMNPTNTVFDAKRLIGRNFNDPIVQSDMKSWPFNVVRGKGNKPMIEVKFQGKKKLFTCEEISAMILTKMKNTAETFLGRDVSQAVITVPAYFNDGQRRATKAAGKIAGLKVLRILNEPTAAAIAYGLNKKSEEEMNILVFDLGGGTFDVSVLSVDEGLFEVMATAGDTHLGGEDFDEIIMKHVVAKYKKKTGHNVATSKRALRRLRTACERAKRVLTVSTKTNIEVDALFQGEDFCQKLTRAKFENLCAKPFKKTLEILNKVLADAELKKDEVDEIVLVGGSTRIPKIQAMITKFFNGKEPCRTINPDEAVAYGAGVQAAVLVGHSKNKAANQVLLIDVTPLSLGIETDSQKMTKIVPRNSTIPCRKRHQVQTVVDNQTQVVFPVYEGERPLTRDNHFLGSFGLMGIPPAPKGVPQFDIEFNLDADGILTVSAQDKKTGQKEQITITNDQGRLNKNEIDRMVADAAEYADADRRQEERLDAKHQLENLLYSIARSMGDPHIGSNINSYERENINSVVSEAEDWLHENDMADAPSHLAMLRKIEAVYHPIMENMYGTKAEPYQPKYDSEMEGNAVKKQEKQHDDDDDDDDSDDDDDGDDDDDDDDDDMGRNVDDDDDDDDDDDSDDDSDDSDDEGDEGDDDSESDDDDDDEGDDDSESDDDDDDDNESND